ncbi:GTP 3',8-cyclase MoaA [Haloferula chungangensis]|uniref:GTP 3',8-cyclase n=1 Tax=Haloferula chungangensis TaxID=1048331 RepID=A0ABW2L857_9BACT
MKPTDQFQRPLRDLRISVTDRCNFRCRYCMPAEVFGPNYAFLPRSEILSFEEIERLARALVPLGVSKLRLTGGEPLLRRGLDDLIGMLATIDGIDDIALTTNGTLLAHHAEALALAGLNRVTVSLDALDPAVFAAMNGVGAKIERVLAGIRAAQTFGLPVKVNAVVQRGVNEQEILPLARWAREHQITLRFIEFMDVGESNAWQMEQVVSAAEILSTLETEFPLRPLPPTHPGETAKRWQHADSSADSSVEIGIIASVTQPFCRACSRLRLSAEGKLFTCLFAATGHDIRPLLRRQESDLALQQDIAALWSARNDRYSEERGQSDRPKAEMSYLGG